MTGEPPERDSMYDLDLKAPKTIKLNIVDYDAQETGGTIAEFYAPTLPQRGERMMLKVTNDRHETTHYNVYEIHRVLWNVLDAPHVTMLSAFVYVKVVPEDCRVWD